MGLGRCQEAGTAEQKGSQQAAETRVPHKKTG
jgi:hypothetical protein